MPTNTSTKTAHWNLASLKLDDAWTDFFDSQQAKNSTPATLQFYRYTAGKFLTWIEAQGVQDPAEITARHVRQYLGQLRDQGRKDTTRNAHARAIKTLLRFWHKEKYIQEAVIFEMPKLEKKRQPVLNADQLEKVLKACDTREKALVSLMVDSGLRRAEVCNLDWIDIDFGSGRVQVKQGKGKKDRTTVVGPTARRALRAYRRTLPERDGAIFRSRKTGDRLTGVGIMQLFNRLHKRTGIKITAHSLRRTFTILAMRAGMEHLYVQNLGGWSSLDMVNHYAQMVDDDLLQAHNKHSPLDSLKRT